VISRRTILLLALWALAIAIPTSYSKGRAFEGRRLQSENYVREDSVLNSFPIVFARTLVGGEPEILRVIAGAGLLLTGICVVSLGFDFARKNTLAEELLTPQSTQESNSTKATEPQEVIIQDASAPDVLQVSKVETNE
jgi:hypothetical protein